MADKTLVILIFDSACRHLGEMATRDGRFEGFTFTPDGERALGGKVKEWQSRGLPVLRDVICEEKDATLFTVFEERVLMRERDFLSSFHDWARINGFRAVNVKEHALPCWELLLRLPLSPVERFSMLYATCRMSTDDIVSWQKALRDARDAAAAVGE